MTAWHGLRSRTRDLFARPFRMIPLSTYKIADYVRSTAPSTRACPHNFYHGRTGSVWNVKRGIGFEINKQISHYSHATTGKHVFFIVDTMNLAKSLEAQGLASKHAEAIGVALTEAVNSTFDKVDENFVKKTDMELFAANSQHKTDQMGAKLQLEINSLGMKIDKVADVLNARLDALSSSLGSDIATSKAELVAKLEGAGMTLSNILLAQLCQYLLLVLLFFAFPQCDLAMETTFWDSWWRVPSWRLS